MPAGFWYWLILVFMVACVFFFGYPIGDPRPWYSRYAWPFWLLVLLIIIGYHDFGSPLDALVKRG